MDGNGDLQRCLDDVGRVQAERIASALDGDDPLEPLAGLGAPRILRVLSSPAIRCIETVTPLATRLGLIVCETRSLFEGADLDEAWEVVEGAAHDEGDTVLCSHGDVIPEVVRRARLRGMHVPTRSGCSKGSIWALSWDGERFDSGLYATTH